MSATSHPNVHLVDHPLIRIRLTRLRDRETDSASFRRNLHEIAQLMVYEITRSFPVKAVEVETPLETTTGAIAERPMVLVPILRAGVGMLNGILQILPDAQIGHIGMYRDEETLEPKSYYCNLPENIGEADTLLIDPMLATGASSVAAAAKLKEEGAGRIHFICLVSCPEGLETFVEAHPDIHVYTAAIDRQLNEKAYIVPGLGDAGDRYFGT